MVHAFVSILGPWHEVPPLDGGGLVQDRYRTCLPLPQVREHFPHLDQPDQPPATEKKSFRK